MEALLGWIEPVAGDTQDASPDIRRRLKQMAACMTHRGKMITDDSSHDCATLACISHQKQPSIFHSAAKDSRGRPQCSLALAGHLWPLSGTAQQQAQSLQNTLDRFTRDGWDAFSGLRGSYIIALYDGRAQRLHLMRDAAGTRTMYFGRTAGGWAFASEPKAILSDASFQKTLRAAGVAQFLSFSFTPGQNTLLEDLFEVPSGHAVSLKTHGTSGKPFSLHRLFDFEQHEGRWSWPPNEIDDREWIQRTRNRIENSVAQRLPKGEPVAVFLSGGLDSSLVAAEVARQHDHRVLTFALHFGPRHQHELDFARMVADRYRTEHHEVAIQPRHFRKRFAEMIWHLDEPIGDPITQPNFELARLVSQDVRYVFNGEGGDPLFGGPKNLPMMIAHWYGIDRGQRFRERAYLASYRRAYEEWDHVLHPRLRSQIDPVRDLENVLTLFFDDSPLRSFLNKLMAINIRLKGGHLILPKVERMLAASGLTPLAPLFDQDLIVDSFEMHPTMKLRHGVEKWILKRAYEDLLPRQIIERPKSGMRVPVHAWFRRDMRRFAKRILLSRQTRRAEWLDPDRIEQLFRYDTEQATGRYGIRLWMLLTLEAWRRTFLSSVSRV
ncbi:MAG: asparagine synthase-related protein [Planctomycetota bacterium]